MLLFFFSIIFLTLQYYIGFAIHQHASAMVIHVVFSGYMPSSGISGSYGSSVFSLAPLFILNSISRASLLPYNHHHSNVAIFL